LAIVIAIVVGVAVAFQANLTSAAQRTMGPVVMVAFSGLATTAVAAGISLFLARPGRAVVYAVVSGILGALILGGIAFAAGQGGVARTISLVIASQLLVSLILDSVGLFGTNPRGFGPPTILGVVLILIGGVLVVRY
jgi:transporter family-2 protein